MTAGSLQGRKPISSLRTEKQTGIARPTRGAGCQPKQFLAPDSGRSVFFLTSPLIGHSDRHDFSGLIQKVFRQPGRRLALAPEILRTLTVHVDCRLPYSRPRQVVHEVEQARALASPYSRTQSEYSFASSSLTVDLNRGVHPPACKFQNC